MRSLWLALFTILELFIGLNCLSPFRNYVVSNEKVIAIEGDPVTLTDFSNLKLIGRERFMNGSIIMLKDMDNNFSFAVEIYRSPNADGNYKKTPFHVPKTKLCDGFKMYYKEFFQPSLKPGENTNLPLIGNDGLCPYPAGEYYVKNFEFNTDSWPNQIPRGALKVVISFFKGDDLIGGFIVILQIEDETR